MNEERISLLIYIYSTKDYQVARLIEALVKGNHSVAQYGELFLYSEFEIETLKI